METFGQKIMTGLKAFWQWFKPKYGRFHRGRKKIWQRYHIHKIFILTVGVLILIFTTFFTYKAQTTDISSLKSGMTQPTQVFDKDGDKAGTLYGEKGTFVDSDKISQNVKDAVVATEDKRFYKHHGFDVIGIARAGVSSLIHLHITGGGSTLTQQLAKNAYLTQQQTFTRKAEELFLAIKIEKKYSKDEILTMYLNKSYFGNGVWGVEDASHKYFGKSAAELSVPEAANLAAILKSPSYYNPIEQPEHALARRNLVIDLMAENKKISETQAKQYKQAPTNLADNYQESRDNRFPYYFDAVIAEAVNKHGLNQDDILAKGSYKIYTTLDQNYQQKMQDTYNNDGLFPANAADGTLVQSASVAMNPKTGGVMAIVGGRGEHTPMGFNRGTDIRVQPGSTMKPIAVYTPALEEGYHYDTVLKDQKLSYKQKNGQIYTPENYTYTYQNEVPMYQAVAQSLNAPAVWLLDKIGLSKGFKAAEEFGIHLKKDEVELSLALGGIKSGVSPMQMANAYATFANEGKRPDSHFITKIVDSTGAVIYNNEDPKTHQVISKEVSDEMTGMLLGVYNYGTGANAKPEGYTIAGKTGSTEYGTDGIGTRDQWMIGYTPDVVVSTWVGFDKVDDEHNLAGTSGSVIAPLFKAEMESILPYTPQTKFTQTDSKSIIDAQQQKEQGGWLNGWQDNFNQWGDQFKEGADYIKGEADKVLNGIKGWFQ